MGVEYLILDVEGALEGIESKMHFIIRPQIRHILEA